MSTPPARTRAARRSPALLLSLVVASGACGGDQRDPAPDDISSDAPDVTDTPPEDADGSGDADSVEDADSTDADALELEFEAGRATLRVDSPSRTITLELDGRVLTSLPADGIQLGVDDRLDPTKTYDPTGFFLRTPTITAPPLDHWTSVVEMSIGGSDIALTFDDGRTATLAVTTTGDERFALTLVPEPSDAEGVVTYARVRTSVDAAERFYGLGEVFDQVEHRGTIRAMQLELDALEGANNEAHVPVPFITSTAGWGLFVETYRPSVFDVAATDSERVDFVAGTAESSADGLTFHLYAADHPLDITRHYYATTGLPAIPAPWALGPLIWRDENDDEAQFRADVTAIRDLDLATTGMWIDRPYATAVGSFDWDPERWDDAAAMIADANDAGLRVGLWSVPYFDEGHPSTDAFVQEAEERGFYPVRAGLHLNNWGRMIDLTNPDARQWWSALVQRYVDDGIEGFKLDYGEDVVVGPFGGRTVWEFFDGSTELTMHARLQRLYHSLYSELLPEDGGFLLCRGGTWGDQVDASIIWPGDLSADFTLHGERVTEEGGDSYLSVGGLPAALIAGLSLGPSGFPLYGSDTGGYRHSPPDKETFTRWFQITALSPVMQVGTSSSDVAWEFDEANGFDEEMLDWYRVYTRLHLRLWPLVWTYLHRTHTDGRPIQRALGLAYPELGVHPSDTFLLGDALLVAPVVVRDARERDVQFPPGQWLDWWTGESIEGPETRTVSAPLDTLPLYARAGDPIPMLRETIDTISPVADPDAIDSFSTTAGILTVRVTTGPERSFTLFDGTLLSQASDDDVTLSYVSGDTFVHGVRFELWASDAPPESVRDEGGAIPRVDAIETWSDETRAWTWRDIRGGEVVVQIPEPSVSVVVSFD